MEVGDAAEVLTVVDSCLSRTKWHLRAPSKRRLETDMLALITGMRPVVMVDYGGMMPELEEHLCSLLDLCRKESTIFLPLRVLVIEEMIYIIHLKELAEHAFSSHCLRTQLSFVDLEHDPPKMLLHTEENVLTSDLIKIQKLFSSVFPVDKVNIDILPAIPNPIVCSRTGASECKDSDLASTAGLHASSQPFHSVNLSNFLQDTHITIPTLNGWLLGYPVVYLFSKEHISDAVYNLSTKSLHIYKVLVCRNKASSSKPCEEELMSFTVPYDLSLSREKEPWAEAFHAHVLTKFERCRRVWRYLKLEVSECYPQAIVL